VVERETRSKKKKQWGTGLVVAWDTPMGRGGLKRRKAKPMDENASQSTTAISNDRTSGGPEKVGQSTHQAANLGDGKRGKRGNSGGEKKGKMPYWGRVIEALPRELA